MGKDGEQILLVAGGYGGVTNQASTEIFYSGSWHEVGPLSHKTSGVSEARLGNTVFMMGGNDGSKQTDTIWSFDADKEEWEELGRMKRARQGHALSTVLIS